MAAPSQQVFYDDIVREMAELHRRLDDVARATANLDDFTLPAGALKPGDFENLGEGWLPGWSMIPGTLNGKLFPTYVLDGNLIIRGTLWADAIVARSITADRIQTNTLTANEIFAGSITADRIKANDITAQYIAAGTITANEIHTATLTANLIAAGTITATNIAAGTITGNLISATTLTGDKLVTGAVTASKISVPDLSAVSANLGSITAGTITGAVVQTASSGARVVINTAGINAFNSTGTPVLAFDVSTGSLTVTGTVNANASSVVPVGTINGQASAAVLLLDNTMAGAKLLVDAVTAREVAAASISSTELTANSVIAGKIAAGTITANEIHTGTITANEMTVTQLSAITANMGTLTAGTITGGTIQTDVVSPRVVFDSSGLRSINSIGVNVFMLDASNGNFTASGGTITGATVQTSLSNPRVIMDSAGLRSLDIVGNQIFTLDASTGSFTATAGTITGATVRTAPSGARAQMDSTGIHGFDGTGAEMFSFTNATGRATLVDATIKTSTGFPRLEITSGKMTLWTTSSNNGVVIDGTNAEPRVLFQNLDLGAGLGNARKGYLYGDTISGTSFQMEIRSDNGLQVLNFAASGFAKMQGVLQDMSDKRYKHDITPVGDALAKVMKLNGATYSLNSDGSSGAGVLAQDLQAVLPEGVAITTLPNGREAMTVSTNAICGLLVEAVKELKTEIDGLKKLKSK